MNSVQLIKQQLGLSYQQLATYLGVSESMLTMAQSGRRSLPAHATILITRLLLLLQNTPAINSTQDDNSQQLIALNKRLQYCNLRLVSLQKKLQKMQEKYQQLKQLQQITAAMKSNPITGKDAKKEKLWAAATAAEATDTIKHYGPQKQILQQLQINCLLYEIEQIKQLIQ